MMQSVQNDAPIRADGPGAGPAPVALGGRRTFRYLVLHGVWSLAVAWGGLYFLSNAASSPEINVWGTRVAAVAGLGLLGSLVIQVAWMGRARVATFRFWAVWYGVLLLGCMVAVPLAMALVPL